MNDFVMNVDSLSGIMEFSKVKERRNLSCVSSLFKETFNYTEDMCIDMAITNLVRERRDRYEFPIVTSKNQTVGECLPKNMDVRRITTYLLTRAIYILNNNFKQSVDLDYISSTIRKDKYMFSIFMKFAAIGLLYKLDPDTKIEKVFQDYSTGHQMYNYLDEPGSLDNNQPIWFHVDGLNDVFRRDLLDGCINRVYYLLVN